MVDREKLSELSSDLLHSLYCIEQLGELHKERNEKECHDLQQQGANKERDVEDGKSNIEEAQQLASQKETAERLLVQETNKIKKKRVLAENELVEMKGVLSKEMVEQIELKQQMEHLNPFTVFWENIFYESIEELKEIFEMIKRDIGDLQPKELPVLNQEEKQLSDAQNGYVKVMEKEENSICHELKDLQKKANDLESEICAAKAREAINAACLKEMKLQIINNQSQREFQKLVDSQHELTEARIKQRVIKLGEILKDIAQKLQQMNL